MIQPLENNVLILLEKKENKTESGIILPEKDEKPTSGRVLAKGDGLGATKLELDSMVVFDKYAGIDIRFEGKEHKILNYNEILAIIK